MGSIKSIIVFISITILALTIYTSCDSSTEPENGPGRRDYVWEVDTIVQDGTYLERIWGSSSNDLWAIARNNYSANIWHYNGANWSNYSTSSPLSPISIWGFSKNNIWIGGSDGRLWHYDGTIWAQKQQFQNPTESRYIGINDIWGDSPNNIWAVGSFDSLGTRRGLILHYNGSTWKKKQISPILGTLMRITRGIKSSKNYFIWNWSFDNINPDSNRLFMFDGNSLTKLYSKPTYESKSARVQNINGEIIITLDNQLNKYENNKIIPFLTNSFPNAWGQTWGRNIKDLFWGMSDGLTHYDGSNLEYILKIDDNIQPSDCILFDKEIILVTFDWNTKTNLIFRGKLN